MTKRHESGGGFKVILLGDRNVGKTRLAEWCQSEGYTEEYSASHDPALYRLLMNTNRGPIHFDVWDLPGEVKSIDILRKHVDDADAAILMFDLQNPSSLDSIPLWLPTANEAFPVALCGNKHEVDQAREYANGILPDGVEEFYSQVGSFTLEWEHMSPELTTGDLPSTGHIQILPITTTFGDNWRGITWFPLPDHIKPRRDDEWRLTYRGVLPFDFFIPEACMCFIQAPDGTLEDHIAYHSFGHELHRTRYTFKDYIERLVASYGFWYWGETLCSESRFSAQVLSFRANMPRIFEGYEDGLFQP
ncbi:GTP-binding nuclear protein Ran [Purpureocillium lavendulum]|uniref:GTP-binding nuclear protein Ran n=1 Tax=Purpureocillium lavendulum TaxID=1247861 RepID=A0AB34FFA6_9HYPO|nr:GTP-binding nuclear protein Ran [Purpureocillium lavendulum]